MLVDVPLSEVEGGAVILTECSVVSLRSEEAVHDNYGGCASG